MAAPGEDITSTWLDDGYRRLDGTSMAAPRVAAAAALLRKQDPDATYGELRAALRDYGDKPPGIKGRVVHDVRLNVAQGAVAHPALSGRRLSARSPASRSP